MRGFRLRQRFEFRQHMSSSGSSSGHLRGLEWVVRLQQRLDLRRLIELRRRNRAPGAAEGPSGAGLDAGMSPTDGGVVQTVGVDGGSGTCGGGAAQSSDVTINVSSLQQRSRASDAPPPGREASTTDERPRYTLVHDDGGRTDLAPHPVRRRARRLPRRPSRHGVTVWMTPWGTGSNGAPGGTDTTTQANPNGCKTAACPCSRTRKIWRTPWPAGCRSAKSAGGADLRRVRRERAGQLRHQPDDLVLGRATGHLDRRLPRPRHGSLGVKVMAPETQNGCGFTGYFSAIQSDTAAWSSVGIFASHEYGCGTLPSEPSIASAGKEYWETEVDTGCRERRLTRRRDAERALDLARRFTTTSPRPTSTPGTTGGCMAATAAAASMTRARRCGPSVSGPWAISRASCGLGASGWRPRDRALGRARERLHQSNEQRAFDRRDQQQHLVDKRARFTSPATRRARSRPTRRRRARAWARAPPSRVSQSRVTVTLSAQSVTTFVGTP